MSQARHPFGRSPAGHEAPGRSPGQGGYLLYRGVASVHPAVSAGDVDFTAPVGCSQAGSPRAYDYAAGLVAGTEYVYALRAVSDSGIPEVGVVCWCSITADGGGVLAGQAPNAVHSAGASAAVAGMLDVWAVYSAHGERGRVTAVQVCQVVAGVAQWGTILTTMTLRGSGRVTASVGPFGDGISVVLAVRAITTDGVTGPQTVITAVVADATAPSAPQGLTVAQEAL